MIELPARPPAQAPWSASSPRASGVAEAELEVARAEQEWLREAVAEGERSLADLRVREQLALAQRDQARAEVQAARRALEQIRTQSEQLRFVRECGRRIAAATCKLLVPMHAGSAAVIRPELTEDQQPWT